MECTNCGESYRGDDIITLGWLREKNPEVADLTCYKTPEEIVAQEHEHA